MSDMLDNHMHQSPLRFKGLTVEVNNNDHHVTMLCSAGIHVDAILTYTSHPKHLCRPSTPSHSNHSSGWGWLLNNCRVLFTNGRSVLFICTFLYVHGKRVHFCVICYCIQVLLLMHLSFGLFWFVRKQRLETVKTNSPFCHIFNMRGYLTLVNFNTSNRINYCNYKNKY